MDPAERVEGGRFAFLDHIRELPSLPQVLVGISRVASDPDSGAATLADVILKDQAMTMKVLRIANSARYAVCPQRITTVSRAVVILGFESVRAMALGLGAFNLLSSLERGGKVHEGFWKDSIASAVICQELADLMGMKAAEEAFVAGLLHDVGKLVLSEVDLERALRVYGSSLEGPELLLAESRAFGVNHAEVAGELARRWELPEVLQKALAYHHRHYRCPPDDRGERMAFLVGVAKVLVGPLSHPPPGTAPRELASQVARLLRKPVGRVLGALEKLPDKVKEYAGFFEIQMHDLKAYALWLEEEHRRLHALSDSVGSARLLEERRRTEMSAIREIHGLILGGRDPGSAILRSLGAAREATGCRRVVVALVTPEGQLTSAWSGGDSTPDFDEAFCFPLSEGGVLADAVAGGIPVNVFERDLPYFTRLLSEREKRVIEVPHFAAVPLMLEGRCVGVLYGDRYPGDDPFSDEEIESLGTFGDLVALALKQGRRVPPGFSS